MSTKNFTVSEVAEIFGITRTQVFRDLQSWPHQREGVINISFTIDDVAEINRIMNAGPDEQLQRLLLLEAKRAEIQALDA